MAAKAAFLAGSRGVARRSSTEAKDVALWVSQDPPPEQAVRTFLHRGRSQLDQAAHFGISVVRHKIAVETVLAHPALWYRLEQQDR
jgi:hypothetical protein